MNKRIKILLTALTLSVAALVSGCGSDADIASRNLSKSADQFEVNRRIVFYNGITGEYMLTIQGLCSLGNTDTSQRLSVTCKISPSEYKKHFLGLSDNVSFIVEQLEPNKVSAYHYKVLFKPQSIIPDVDLLVK